MRGSPTSSASIDGHPVAERLNELRHAAYRADIATIKRILSHLADDESRAFALRDLARIETMAPCAETAWRGDPTDRFIALLHASCLVETGWRIRTDYMPEHVSAQQFRSFREYLCQAEQVLLDRTARVPDDAVAWTLRLTTGRGLEVGQSEARRRYERAVATNPHNLVAQTQFLQKLCPKWGGSFDAVDSFARACTDSSPIGSTNAMLIAEAHLEHWLPLSDSGQVAYLRQDSVRREVTDAAQRSVWHPDARKTCYTTSAHSTFALVFSLLGDRHAAARHFDAMGNAAPGTFWGYLGDSAAEYAHHRALAYEEARA